MRHAAYEVEGKFERHVRRKISGYIKTQYTIADSATGFADELAIGKTSGAVKRIFAFVDGPKSGKPLRRVITTLRGANVEAICCHDCYPGGRTRSDFEQACFGTWPSGKMVFTDADMLSEYASLNDWICAAIAAAKGQEAEEFGAKTACLGLFGPGGFGWAKK